MTTIITRIGKGSPLTNLELDSNFSNLNNDKLEISAFSTTADNWLSSKTLNNISDVEISSPTDGQALVWSATLNKWVNADQTGSGSGLEGNNLVFPNLGANQLDTFSAQTYSTVKYFIQVTNNSNIYSTEITLMHDGLNVYMTEYGTLYTTNLCSFDAQIVNGNIIFTINTNQTNTYVDYKRIALTTRLQSGVVEWDYAGDLGLLTGVIDLMLDSGSIDLMSGDVISTNEDLLSLVGTEDLLTASGSLDLMSDEPLLSDDLLLMSGTEDLITSSGSTDLIL